MSRIAIPAHVIAQRGKKITLIDGSEVTVVFTFSSLMRVEEDFGSIMGALAAVKQGTNAQAFTSIATILAAGLEHVTYGDVPLSDVETLRTLLDPMLFDSYSDQMGAALDAAFPDEKEGDGEHDADPQTDSRGESGTTSPSSSSDEARTSSGA